MAAWLTLYCRRPCTLSVSDIAIELRAADLLMLAEAHDVDEALAREARPRFVPFDVPLERTELFWKEVEHRPLVFHHWTAARALEEIEETRALEMPADIAKILDDVVEVVGIEMGFSALADFGFVLAFEVARIIGHASAGFVRDEDDQWSLLDGGGAWQHL